MFWRLAFSCIGPRLLFRRLDLFELIEKTKQVVIRHDCTVKLPGLCIYIYRGELRGAGIQSALFAGDRHFSGPDCTRMMPEQAPVTS